MATTTHSHLASMLKKESRTSWPVLRWNLPLPLKLYGVPGGAVGWSTEPQAGRSHVRFPILSMEFFFDVILLATPCSWSWLSLLQKWVSGIFLGGKGCRCVGLTTSPPSCAECLEIWEPQPPGNLRVCPGLSWDGCNFLYVYIYFNWHILPKGVSILLFFFLSFWQRSSNSTSKYKGEFPIGTVVTSWYKVRFWRL